MNLSGFSRNILEGWAKDCCVHVFLVGESNAEVVKLSKWETSTIARKQRTYNYNEIITPESKKAVPKWDLYDMLTLAHSRTAHRGRQITLK